MFLLFIFTSCEVINSVTVGPDGEATFNPPLKTLPEDILKPTAKNESNTTKSTKTSKPTVTSKPTDKPKQTTPFIPQQKTLLPGQQPIDTLGTDLLPTFDGTQEDGVKGSIMEGLPSLTKSVFLTERESAGMPRVNGERIEADIYGDNILIVKYTRAISKVRYSNDISVIKTLGEVEGQNARVQYPISFVKIFFEDDNGDSVSKIFGVVDR
jgi:hypothetical protein